MDCNPFPTILLIISINFAYYFCLFPWIKKNHIFPFIILYYLSYLCSTCVYSDKYYFTDYTPNKITCQYVSILSKKMTQHPRPPVSKKASDSYTSGRRFYCLGFIILYSALATAFFFFKIAIPNVIAAITIAAAVAMATAIQLMLARPAKSNSPDSGF